MSREFFAGFIAVALLGTVASTAQADAVSDFYKGKNIEIIVCAGAGGGYGLYNRALAQFMPRHIPGQPTMTLKFMQGSAGIKGANYIYNVAPKGGTTLGALISSAATSEATGRKGVRYKSARMQWIGRLVDIITVVTVKRNAPATTIEQMKKIPIVAGTTRPGGPNHFPFAIMNWALGTKIKIVTGYKGSNGVALAYDRGEVHAAAAPWGTLRARRPHFLKDFLIVQVALAKDRIRQDVPLLLDLVTDPAKKAAVKFLSAQGSIGRTLSAPPGVPKARVAALRKAFDATMKDPDFLATAKKRKMDLAPLSGALLEQMVVEHLAAPADIIRLAKKASGMK